MKTNLFKIVTYERDRIDHYGLTYREALDLQREMIKIEGNEEPNYLFTIEEYDGDSEV
tara:strand:- start:545 stop:718 length:174 start_codon:yes stop_codon:yes gene_type:complete